MSTVLELKKRVIDAGICTSCGLCVALDASEQSKMRATRKGPLPDLSQDAQLPDYMLQACPGRGINYPQLYKSHYQQLPKNWLQGHVEKVYVGHASDEHVRRSAASGGLITATLLHLLEEKHIDFAIVVKQGVDSPENAKAIITNDPNEIILSAQSVYAPVAVLEVLTNLDPNKRYAMTCLPEQSAALRFLQSKAHPQANSVKFVLGPYTGTALYPEAIQAFLSGKGVSSKDKITSLKWRAGEWPGYLEVKLESGKVVRAEKFYYNYLIPFFVTQTSLQSMDFANEFCDLSVGDAWSPQYEAQRGGFSVATTRSKAMDSIIQEMIAKQEITATETDPLESLNMHGHMLDFKKRGSFIRNRLRRMIGKQAPDYGIEPSPLPFSRWAVECVITSIFIICHLRISIWIINLFPESVIGPLFNFLRKTWKGMSKPTKRKGLRNIQMKETTPNE